MRISCFAITLLLVTIVRTGLSQDDSGGVRLTDRRYHELIEELTPGDEPWLTIPWKTRLLDAQNAASREGKPIFIWAMDGHPLGCT